MNMAPGKIYCQVQSNRPKNMHTSTWKKQVLNLKPLKSLNWLYVCVAEPGCSVVTSVGA